MNPFLFALLTLPHTLLGIKITHTFFSVKCAILVNMVMKMKSKKNDEIRIKTKIDELKFLLQFFKDSFTDFRFYFETEI